MLITTNITNTDLQNGSKGLELKSVAVVVNFQEKENYFGGQVVLTKDENITLQSTTEEIASLAIKKAKSLIANSKVVETEPLPTEKNIGTTDVGTEEKAEETAK